MIISLSTLYSNRKHIIIIADFSNKYSIKFYLIPILIDTPTFFSYLFLDNNYNYNSYYYTISNIDDNNSYNINLLSHLGYNISTFNYPFNFPKLSEMPKLNTNSNLYRDTYIYPSDFYFTHYVECTLQNEKILKNNITIEKITTTYIYNNNQITTTIFNNDENNQQNTININIRYNENEEIPHLIFFNRYKNTIILIKLENLKFNPHKTNYTINYLPKTYKLLCKYDNTNNTIFPLYLNLNKNNNISNHLIFDYEKNKYKININNILKKHYTNTNFYFYIEERYNFDNEVKFNTNFQCYTIDLI